MKSLSLLFVVALTSVAFAQEDLRNELNDEISVLYPKTTLKKKPGVKRIAQRQDVGGLEEESRGVIINNNLNAPVKEEPSTTVEAAPVEASKGLEVRKAREQVERGTEDTIVQQLEKDRLEAERERSKRAAEAFEPKQKEVVAPAPPIAVQEVAPPPPVVYVAPTQTVKTEVDKSQSLDQVDGKTQMYIGALGGFGSYATASNVQGKMAAGILLGVEFPENFILEGNVVFSQYDINNVPACTQTDVAGNCIGLITPINQRMTQTNVGVTGKYAFLKGRIRPMVGGILTYTKRSFENRNNSYYQNAYNYSSTRQSYPDSWAIDGGVSIGVDVALSPKFAIGADFKYLTNLTYDREDNPTTRSYGNSQPVEELSYYIFSAAATFRF